MLSLLVPIGTALALLGVAGLVWCIVAAMRARRLDLPDEEMKARLSKLLAVNLGALAVAAIGLMTLIMGLFLT
ncbi:MAG: hypothetical protein AAFR53_06770 [Pseudomonadota bacterium]